MFDLTSLGWHSFQQLCLTISREVLGQTVESFLDSNDAGQDGAFVGIWRRVRGEALRGRFVIQCKFTSKPGGTLRLQDLSEEIPKVERLVKQGACESYVLMTNAGISGRQAQEIKTAIRQAGVKHVAVFGSTWITQQIRENKRLRMLMPRVYGLGDLSQIIDERAYLQARVILESLREDLKKVVVTDAYRRAADALDRHGFVLLIGEPAAGKTTIATMLAMAAADQWGASVLKLDDPSEVVRHWNPDEPSQFFWVDDAFGVTQYEPSLVLRWNHGVAQIKAMVNRGAKVVMTSRDYIYNYARRDLKESAFPLLKESQVVIDVHELSLEEKQQILYNHMKLGKQPAEFRTAVKPFLEGVSGNKRFVPEVARRLADPIFTKTLQVSQFDLAMFVETREHLLQEVLQSLDNNSKAALALIYMRNGQLISPASLIDSERAAIDRLGSSLGGCVIALEAMADSLVALRSVDGGAVWQFKHPTIGDAYATNLARSPELLGIFVQGSDAERLVEQVTCGDVGRENAVVIPRGLFPDVLLKLDELSSSKGFKSKTLSAWDAKRKLQRFLAYRCSAEFLMRFVERTPSILDDICKPQLSLYFSSEVSLASRLSECGLLPESHRRSFLTAVGAFAIDGLDMGALGDADIKGLYKGNEYDQLVADVKRQLIPSLHKVRNEAESSYRSSDPPEDHMQDTLSSLDTLKEVFQGDQVTLAVIERETERIREWIEEQEPEFKPGRVQSLGSVSTAAIHTTVRSIFDDVDQ